MGDFNLPSIIWTEDGGMLGGEGRVDRMFLECFAAAGLTQWVMEATFVSSGNTLYLFLTSEVDRVGSIKVHASFPKCRHTPVVCEYLFNSDLNADVYNEVQLKYLWRRGDYCRLSNALSRVD